MVRRIPDLAGWLHHSNVIITPCPSYSIIITDGEDNKECRSPPGAVGKQPTITPVTMQHLKSMVEHVLHKLTRVHPTSQEGCRYGMDVAVDPNEMEPFMDMMTTALLKFCKENNWNSFIVYPSSKTFACVRVTR